MGDDGIGVIGPDGARPEVGIAPDGLVALRGLLGLGIVMAGLAVTALGLWWIYAYMARGWEPALAARLALPELDASAGRLSPAELTEAVVRSASDKSWVEVPA